MDHRRSGSRGLASFACGLAGIVLLAACSASPAASSRAATAPVVTPAATAAGPTAFADWVARQGFGGSSGLNNINKLVIYLNEHGSTYALADIDADAADVAHLLAWLDAHPATACWTAYRATMTASLQTLVNDYTAVHAAVAAGRTPPLDVTTAMADESAAAKALPQPPNCP